jgi:hypothetical protein
MEPTTGIEPVNLFLTKEALYLLSYVGSKGAPRHASLSAVLSDCRLVGVERATRFELATFSLEG